MDDVELKEDKSLLGVPLMPSNARNIVIELFKKKPQWSNEEMWSEIERLHKSRGGVSGTQSVARVTKKAIAMVKDSGLIENPWSGTWRLKGISTDELETISRQDEKPNIVIEKTTGEGSECVYVYFDPIHREFAKLKNQDFWACKIGETKKSVAERILEQNIKTSFSYYPVVGLVIKTNDSEFLEKTIHAALRSSEKEPLDCPGSEWFLTSPEIIERWYGLYTKSLESLKIETSLDL